MSHKIILSIVFGAGIVYYIYVAIKEWTSKKEKNYYKIKYYSLWSIIFAYLIYMQYTD